MPQTIVFTDLDGTLLDYDSYAFQPAIPALDKLRQREIPVVLLTSKTLEETLSWREQMNNRHPFAVENGAALYVPGGSMVLPETARRVDSYENYDVVEFGAPYAELVRCLRGAARESGCRVRGFSDMSVEEVARTCGLPADQAALAKSRRYDEPFVVTRGDIDTLQRAIERRGLRLTRGGRFLHITGQNDKADAVLLLIEAYRQSGPVRTVGLGDGMNDVGFLNLMDTPVLLDSPQAEELAKRVPRARIVPPGPAGWNLAMLKVISEMIPIRACGAPPGTLE